MNHSGGANRSNRGLCVLQVTTGIHSCVLRHIRSSALRHIGELQDTGRWRGFSTANVVRRYPPAHVSICSLVNAWRHYVFTQSSSRPHLFNCASTIAVHTVGVELVGLFVDVTSPMPWTARSTGTDGAGIHVLVLAYGVRVWQLQYSATAVTSMYKENDTLKCYAMRFRFAAPVLLFNTKRCQRWKVKLLPIDFPPINCAIH